MEAEVSKTGDAAWPGFKRLYKSGESDAELWNEFRKGSESAFIHIYETYFRELYKYASQFTQNEELIKDVIQDLFIDLRKKRKSLGKTDNIKFYLYRSVRRRLVAALKKWEDKRIPLKGHDFRFEFSAEYKMIERQLEQEVFTELNNAIAELTVRQREAIYYFFYEGMGYQEIQELMNFTHVRSVRNLIYRSLSKLKEIVPPLLLCLILFDRSAFVF